MMHSSNSSSTLCYRSVVFSGLVAMLALGSSAGAASLDFNVASGNYSVAANWVDSTTGAPAAAPPGYVDVTTNDDAFVRNNGTVTITGDVSNHLLRIGASHVITLPDSTLQETGGSGTLNWTGGKITAGSGPVPTDTTTYYGPDIRLGQHVFANPSGTPPTPEYDLAGIVTQNGATTELDLLHTTSRLNIGENGFTLNPTSTYNLVNGTIALVVGYTVPFVGDTQGSNGNNGINVKSGTFNMSGGQIIDKTIEVAEANGIPSPSIAGQRFLTIASTSGSDAANLNSATANFTGGTVNVRGGLRVATGSNARGFLNITGPVMMSLGEEVSVGYNVNNGVGVMNMSDGQLTIGTATAQKRLQIGHRGNGTLNLSGGSITISGDLRVGSQTESPNSLVNMTGGTLTTRQLQMQLQPPGGGGTPTIIIDGANANFIQGPNGATDQATIGQQGAALFEVRQGQATLNQIQLGNVNSNGTTSNGTVNVKGGKLKITGPVLKTDPNATPTVNLTGGVLEITPRTAGTATWQTSFANTGSELNLNPNTIQQVTISTTSGSATISEFAMSSGSWDVEIGSNVTASGADRFIVNGSGTASLTGGTLNISRINGYSPTINDTLTILQGGGGASLTAAAVTLAGDPGWSLISNATQIQLKYLGAVGVSGDYNNNGVVDAADYVLWRNGGPLQNDPTPGVQASDYTYWRSRFGATAGAGAGVSANVSAVPEPSSLVLFTFAVVGGLAAGRRTSHDVRKDASVIDRS